jgi:peroxiredoxin
MGKNGMAIQSGDRIPGVTLAVMADDVPAPLDTTDLFAGKKVVLFAVPGAFTPTCSVRHLPGFMDLLDDLHGAGIDTVACMAVNDVYVMHAWGKSAGADGILMLADGNAEFTRALGLELDATPFGMGLRSQRFALVAEDGVVKQVFVEQAGEFRVSSAEHVLANL